MFGIVINNNTGFVIDKCVIIKEYALQDNEEIIEYANNIGNPVVNMNKPQWKFDTEEWVDADPLPPEEIEPEELNQMEVLEKRVAELEEENKLFQKENKLLRAQVEVLGDTTEFHEELITEMAMKVYA